jgi:hypothetical protein
MVSRPFSIRSLKNTLFCYKEVMMSALVYWAITGVVMIVLAGLIGRRAKYWTDEGKEVSKNWLGILIDERQRFSLTHLQVVLWSLVLLSLLAALFLARLFGGVAPTEILKITIPQEILVLAGISGGSAVIATAAKSTRTDEIRKLGTSGSKIVPLDSTPNAKPLPAHFSQIFMVEDGDMIDKVVDAAKFQNFFLTLIAVGAYVVIAASVLASTTNLNNLAFPGFSPDLLWLVGISHAAYVGNKFVPQK